MCGKMFVDTRDYNIYIFADTLPLRSRCRHKNINILEMINMKNKAVEYYKSGYSCAESVIQTAIDEGLCDSALLPCATTFSGGMSSGCLCGAVAAAQIVLGYNFGRENSKGNEVIARAKAKELVDEFKNRNKVTCCKALTAGLEGAQRKEHCCKMVSDAVEILEQLAKVKV